MTVACLSCAVRFPPGRKLCPRCGGDDLLDLSLSDERKWFLSARMNAAAPGDRRRFYNAMAAVGGAAAVSVGLLTAGAGLGVAMGALFLLGMPAGQLVRAARDELRRTDPRPRVDLTPLAIAPPLTQGGEPRTAAGRIHIRRSVRAPVSGRACAAWRVTGMGPSGVIDDAGVGGFDIFADGRPVARVEAEQAFVDLGPAGALELRHLEGAVADVLRTRGRVPDHASCAVAESLLLEGEVVEVSGPAVREIVSGGLRDAPEVWIFREWPTIRVLLDDARRGGAQRGA